jgi:Mrp family chromosome partitioning ATPase
VETITSERENGKIKHVVAVMSGKGGVGKSLVTSLLATSLREQGLYVGILDGDLTCPTIAHMFHVEDQLPEYTDDGIGPLVSESGIKIISMTMFAEDKSEPLVWRGPMVSSAFKQFYSEVVWGQLDYLLVDVPPGTSDVPMTALQSLPLDGVIIVSSPQVLATAVVKKCIKMVNQFKAPVLGIVENMAYFIAPGEEYCEIFGPTNSHKLTSLAGAPLLARLPIDPELALLCDAGQIEEYHAESCNILATNFMKALEARDL